MLFQKWRPLFSFLLLFCGAQYASTQDIQSPDTLADEIRSISEQIDSLTTQLETLLTQRSELLSVLNEQESLEAQWNERLLQLTTQLAKQQLDIERWRSGYGSLLIQLRHWKISFVIGIPVAIVGTALLTNYVIRR